MRGRSDCNCKKGMLCLTIIIFVMAYVSLFLAREMLTTNLGKLTDGIRAVLAFTYTARIERWRPASRTDFPMRWASR